MPYMRHGKKITQEEYDALNCVEVPKEVKTPIKETKMAAKPFRMIVKEPKKKAK